MEQISSTSPSTLRGASGRPSPPVLSSLSIVSSQRCSDMAHLYRRLTPSTLPLGAWTLTPRARVALSAACLCNSGSANSRRCKPSTAMDVVWCSTFHRKPTFCKSGHRRSHKADEQLTAMAYLSDRMRTLAAIGCPQAAELLEKADELDKALAEDPSDLTTVLGAWARANRAGDRRCRSFA